MNRHNPLISVLIPSYNHECYIEETIRSVWAQTYRNIEIVVVDDRSPDGTVALLQKLRHISPVPMTIVVNEQQLGPSRNCNKAIAYAKGELVTFMASDDFFVPEAFGARVAAFQNDPGLMAVYGNGRVLCEDKDTGPVHKDKVSEIFRKTKEEILEYLYIHTSPVFIQTLLIRKKFLLESGGFDEDMIADDWVLNTRIFKHLVKSGGAFKYIDEPVFFYRQHQSNIHKNFGRQSRLKVEFIEKYTPERLKRKATANIVSRLAIQAIQCKYYRDAIHFWWMSQKARPNPFQTIKFLRKMFFSFFR